MLGMNQPKLSVAIADDYPRWRSFLHDYLSKEGFIISSKARNGMELLSQLAMGNELPTFCILDIKMPVMNGFETAKALRAQYPSIRILAFSLEMGRGIVNRMLDSGAHGFIAKGVTPQDIKSALLELLQNEIQPQT